MESINVFVLDPHPIYRRGLAASLELIDDVDAVAQAESVRDAWETPALFDADIVLLDTCVSGSSDFIPAARQANAARVIVCTSDCAPDSVADALEAGACGFLCKESLTQSMLKAALDAARHGVGLVVPDVLGSVLARRSEVTPACAEGPLLTQREQRVLSLVAEGHPTREVAEQLSYSERTVKNILHDVVTKLNARSRSQAVAQAVRDGLI